MPNQNPPKQVNTNYKPLFLHIGAYILVNMVLCIYSIFKVNSFTPFLITSIGWGILVLIHARTALK